MLIFLFNCFSVSKEILISTCSDLGSFCTEPLGEDGDITTWGWDHNYFCVLLLCIFHFDLTLIIYVHKVISRPFLQGPHSGVLLCIDLLGVWTSPIL
jgi:hypothetical protein